MSAADHLQSTPTHQPAHCEPNDYGPASTNLQIN